VELYSGPEYEIFFKLSFLMKIVFFAFMYGMHLPIIIPFCFLAIGNLYIMEKLTLAFYYKKPPSYDLKIIKNVVRTLRFGPTHGLISIGWILGNNQMFGNNLNLL
jgi:hypothetical protein